jgi:hypothetical protein
MDDDWWQQGDNDFGVQRGGCVWVCVGDEARWCLKIWCTIPLSWICHRHVACRDIIVDFGVDSQSTATFCCAWHIICCQCKKCVSNMSIVIDIDLWADIKWCQCKNVSDVSRRVTCVTGVCRLWGDLPTDRKTTYPAKLFLRRKCWIFWARGYMHLMPICGSSRCWLVGFGGGFASLRLQSSESQVSI